MKTTLNIPHEHMDELKYYYKGKTKTAIVVLALDTLLAKKRAEDFWGLKGATKGEKFDVDSLRDRNHYKKWQS